ALDVDWKIAPQRDASTEENEKRSRILNKAATIESNEWDKSDEAKTIKFKRQIGEAIARSIDGHFAIADEMLEAAEAFRRNAVDTAARRASIQEQIKIKNAWRSWLRVWITIHYTIGICAILASTLVASKPMWLENGQSSFLAWCVAALT